MTKTVLTLWATGDAEPLERAGLAKSGAKKDFGGSLWEHYTVTCEYTEAERILTAVAGVDFATPAIVTVPDGYNFVFDFDTGKNG